MVSVIAAVIAAGAGVSLRLTADDPAPSPVSEPEPPGDAALADPFWDGLAVTAAEFFVPTSLRELAEPADLIVRGHVVDVESEGEVVSPVGERSGLERVFLQVKMDEVVDGFAPTGRSDGVIDVQLLKPASVPLDAITASLPDGEQLYVLYNVGADIASVGGSRAQVEEYAGVFAPLSTRGIISARPDGTLIAVQVPDTPIDTVTDGAMSLEELAARLRAARQACDATTDCLRGVFSDRPTRGRLSDWRTQV